MNGLSHRESSSGFGARFRLSLERLFTGYLDRATVYPRSRWFIFFCLISLFTTRIIIVQGNNYMVDLKNSRFNFNSTGFFVVCYALAIYLLNLFIGFLTPQVDPEADGYVLPVRQV